MVADKKMQRIGTEAVKKLRLRKLNNGHPFMINSRELPSNQCYLEYPEGPIKLVSLSNTIDEFEVVRTLSHKEADIIKSKYQLA